MLPRRTFYWSLKRSIDIVASFVLIVLLLPVFGLVAIAVAFDVGLPLWFWQQRPGVGKIPFKVFKFRTMRGAYDWNGQRIPDNQRSSPVGQILRRSRLDELPQLWNILIGEMSFVGPRPLLAIDQSCSDDGRLLIRPGLTGWAQVNGGRLLSIPDKMALDLWYLQNASFAVDLNIVVKTVSMILFGEYRNDGAIARALACLPTPTTDRQPDNQPTAGLPINLPTRRVA